MNDDEKYAKIKAEYEASTDEKLVEWARPYFEGTKKPNSKDKYVICPVSERAANDIMELTGSVVHGFNHVLRCDEVRHTRNRHGKKGKADNTLRDISDLGRLAYVLQNYDEIIVPGSQSKGFNNKNNQSAEIILFVKRINGNVIVAEAMTDSPDKKALQIQSMYKAKTSAYLTQKKELAVADENKDPRPNVRNEANSITSILPQLEKNVNSLEEKSFSAPAEQTRIAGAERAKRAAEIAEIKAELRGKNPKEVAEISRQAQQKNKQNGKNSSNNVGKPPSGNGSGGNAGR